MKPHSQLNQEPAFRTPKTRRNFLGTAGAMAATSMATGGWLANAGFVHAGPSRQSLADTIIGEFYESLTANQRTTVCKSFDDPLRKQVDANWHVVKANIASDFYSKSQQSMALEIVKQLTSESGHETILKQTEDDDGGLGAYSVAWFGKPGDDSFEWMLTGRHLTLRADGNTQKKTVFGGPIVYGHGEESSPEENLFYFQTQMVNRVFAALDPEQRKQALLATDIPGESNVLVEARDVYPGLSVSKLSDDQRQLVNQALTSILGVYREEDAAEAKEILNEVGGLQSLNLQFYANDDLKSDGVWDMWRIVGKRATIHFRGAPHVHAYIHIQG